MPARGDLDPVDLKALLPLLILIDVVPDERRYVYRLVGTREVEMRGGDPTGKAVKDAYYAESAEDKTSAISIAWCARASRCSIAAPISRSARAPSARTSSSCRCPRTAEAVNMILILGHIDWLKDEPQV